MRDNWPSVLFAMAGGIFLGLGNLVAQYAWAFAGLSVTNIICASLTVVLGDNDISGSCLARLQFCRFLNIVLCIIQGLA